MSQIRILGPPEASIERDLLEEVRRGAPAGQPRPVCLAPFAAVRIGPDGSVRPCDFAAGSLGNAYERPLAEVWAGADFGRMREEMGEGVLRRETCGGCIRRFESGLFAHSPPVRIFDRPDSGPASAAAPSVVVLDLGEGATEPPTRLLDELARLLPGLRRFEIHGTEPLSSGAAARLLGALRAPPGKAPPSPAVVVAGRKFPDPAKAASLLRGLRSLRLRLLVDGPVRPAAVSTARRVAKDIQVPFDVAFTVGPSNWFDLVPLARACAQSGARFAPRIENEAGERPLAALAVPEIRVVLNALDRERAAFVEPDRLSSVGEGEFDAFLEEMRSLHAERALEGPAGLAPTGTAALELPPVGHPVVEDEEALLALLQQLRRIHGSPTIHAWARANASSPGFAARARERFGLRWLALWGACEASDPACLEALRAVYGERSERARLVREDRAEIGRLGLTDSLEPWLRSLGIASAEPRRPPFPIPPPSTRPATGAADVTVVVPSYRHEAFVESAIRSCLAQTHGRLRVLVVDDASPDGTVERARAIDDGRIVVQANARNVGLGGSVRAALRRVDTPFVAILNSDDVFHPERIERALRAFERDPSVSLVATALALVDRDGGRITPTDASLLLDGREIADWVAWYERARSEAPREGPWFEALLRRNFLATSSNLVCRTAWLRAEARRAKGLRYCLDWQLFLDAAREGSLAVLPEELLAYRLHPANTVWFREGRRWTYFLEQQVVAARAVRAFAAEAGRGAGARERRLASVLDAVVGGLAENGEADGWTLFLTELFREGELERAAERSPAVRARIESLAARAGTVPPEDSAARSARANAGELEYLRWLRSFAEARGDRLGRVEGSERFLRGYARDLERRLREAWIGRDRLEAEKAGLVAAKEGLETARADLEERLLALEGIVAEKEELERAEEELRRNLRAAEAALGLAHDDRARAERDSERLSRRIAEIRAVGESFARERDEALADAGRLQRDLDATAAESDWRRRELEAQAEARRGDARRHAREMEALRREREWRIGDLLWNRTGASRASRIAKRRIKFLRDARNRARLGIWGRTHGGAPARRAVVAACWHFPYFSQTFVYEEMQGLRRMGFDLRLFYWADNPRRFLHDAYGYLWRNRVRLEADWAIHQRDLAWARETHGPRLEAFLRLLERETGRDRASLMGESIVVQGCTFARHVAASRAAYLHSYFFYDESFLAMMAAYLLGLPRGVTAYADHMIQDYPFKCVRLHLETADVVVATSRRIREELLAMGGERFAGKILVKPNGVDGSRFRFVDREGRGAVPLELASVSRIEPKKGLLDLVEALAILRDRGVPVRLHLVGAPDPHSEASAEYARALDERIEALRVGESIVRHGMKRQEEVRAILEVASAFVAPYVEIETGDKDGIPTASLEALATGLPLVATDAGSLSEVFDDGVEGLAVRQRDPVSLADALQRIAADADLRARMGKAARRRFEASFDATVVERGLHERIEARLGAAAGNGRDGG